MYMVSTYNVYWYYRVEQPLKRKVHMLLVLLCLASRSGYMVAVHGYYTKVTL
jgi:hypothetical protein